MDEPDAADNAQTRINDPLIGRSLGPCTLRKRLGQGAMGQVYLAHHETLDMPVAVKVLPPNLASERQFQARFQREARAAARLEHPNVVRVMDVGCTGDVHYLVMEYIEGCSLGELLRSRGQLEAEYALKLIRAAAVGLAAAHKTGLLHRDIKPDNLMLTTSGRLKVADFGLARHENSTKISVTGQVLGTPSFMSPEQARGDALDPRSDVCSLGLTLHCLLSGKSPFERENVFACLRAVCEESTPRLPLRYSSRNLQALVDRMTAKDPQARYADMLAVIEAIDSVAAGRPLAPAPPAAGSRRPRIVAGVIAFAVVLLAVILGLALRHRSQPERPERMQQAQREIPATRLAPVAQQTRPTGVVLRTDLELLHEHLGQAGSIADRLDWYRAFLSEARTPEVRRAVLALRQQLVQGLQQQALIGLLGSIERELREHRYEAAARRLSAFGEALPQEFGAESWQRLRARAQQRIFMHQLGWLGGRLRAASRSAMGELEAEIQALRTWNRVDLFRKQQALLRLHALKLTRLSRPVTPLPRETATLAQWQRAVQQAHQLAVKQDRLVDGLAAHAKLLKAPRFAPHRKRSSRWLIELRALAMVVDLYPKQLAKLIQRGRPIAVEQEGEQGEVQLTPLELLGALSPPGQIRQLRYRRGELTEQLTPSRRQLIRWAYPAMPRERADLSAGIALWLLGQQDEARPYLERARTRHATVVEVYLGPPATGPPVFGALRKAPSFNLRSYLARRQRLPEEKLLPFVLQALRRLNGPRIKVLSHGLRNGQLIELDLSGTDPSGGSRNRVLFDLRPLTGLPLRELSLSGTMVRDLRPLIGMPLRKLQLASCPVEDISVLGRLGGLVELDLSLCVRLRRIAPLGSLRKLNVLDLSFLPITDLTPLRRVPLEDLRFAGCPIGKLATLRSLREIDQSRAPWIGYLLGDQDQQAFLDSASTFDSWGRAMAALYVGLRQARKGQRRQAQRTFDEAARKIQTTHGDWGAWMIRNAAAETLGLRPPGFSRFLRERDRQSTLEGKLKRVLKRLGRLNRTHLIASYDARARTLDLSGNPMLVDLRPLQGLPLKGLILDDTGIRTLSVLATLEQLVLLSLRNCVSLTSVKPLSKLPRLWSIDLRGCRQLLDLRPIEKLAALRLIRLDK